MSLQPPPTRWVSDLTGVWLLLREGGILHTPVGIKCELTFLHEETVEAECSAVIWTAYLQSIRNGTNAHALKHVFLREPNCAGTWCIVSARNIEALEWEADPANEPTPEPPSHSKRNLL